MGVYIKNGDKAVQIPPEVLAKGRAAVEEFASKQTSAPKVAAPKAAPRKKD